MENIEKNWMRFKTPAELERQVQEVNELRQQRKQEELYPAPEDFSLTEKQLKDKYGEQYDRYRESLKEVVREKITQAQSEDEVFSTAHDLLGDVKFSEFKDQMQEAFHDGEEKPLSKIKNIAFSLIMSLMSLSITMGVVTTAVEFYGRSQYAERVSVGKTNPILAAQSADGMIFKGDNGLIGPRGERYGSLEQVIALPSSIDYRNETEKTAVEQQYQEGGITSAEHKERLWKVESQKKQGFLDAYEKRILSFEEVVENIVSHGRTGMPTTLNFGDSSTSGWNSNVLTQNSIEVARLLLPEFRMRDPNLSGTLEELVLKKHFPFGSGFSMRTFDTAMALEAERIRQRPDFREVWNSKWDEVRQATKSPFMTYDTYSDKLAQIDGNHYYVNLGVPGYSSAHGKAYARRMLDQLRGAGALEYVDSATIYFGNNDSVNNGNIQDRFFIGDDIQRQFHAEGILRERFPKLFNATRVREKDFENNLEEMIQVIFDNGIKRVTLFTPVVPYGWDPGQRALGDAQEVIEEEYQVGGKVSGLLRHARDRFADYRIALSKVGNDDRKEYVKAEQLAREALENDFFVPRRKQEYVEGIVRVAQKTGVALVNINEVLPIDDMEGVSSSPKDSRNITNDYCHPGEHVNILLAVAQAYSAIGDTQRFLEVKQNAMDQLIRLGVDQDIAQKEVEQVITNCVILSNAESVSDYQKLAHSDRVRMTWDVSP